LTSPLNQRNSTVLLDVEGTTTPIDFVYKVLFPFALAHAEQFLKRQISSAQVRSDVEGLRKQNLEDVRQGLEPPPFHDDTPDVEIQSVVAYMEWLTAQDRKSPPFKFLQGRIWEEGYRSGALRAEFFDDIPRALMRWQEQGKKIAIFSGGSVLAQKLLFAHTVAGDLSRHISGYFDTTTGSKTDVKSYKKIATALQTQPSQVVFISDVTAELDAARSAGFQTLLSIRPGNRPQPASSHPVVRSFDEVAF